MKTGTGEMNWDRRASIVGAHYMSAAYPGKRFQKFSVRHLPSAYILRVDLVDGDEGRKPKGWDGSCGRDPSPSVSRCDCRDELPSRARSGQGGRSYGRSCIPRLQQSLPAQPVLCPLFVIWLKQESLAEIGASAPGEQRAIGEAGQGCAADRLLR